MICPRRSPPWAFSYCPHHRFPLGENGIVRLLPLTLTQTHQFCSYATTSSKSTSCRHPPSKTSSKNFIYYCMYSTEYHHPYCMYSKIRIQYFNIFVRCIPDLGVLGNPLAALWVCCSCSCEGGAALVHTDHRGVEQRLNTQKHRWTSTEHNKQLNSEQRLNTQKQLNSDWK